jgi:hypothetical protein
MDDVEFLAKYLRRILSEASYGLGDMADGEDYDRLKSLLYPEECGDDSGIE